tara:strand:+ start:6959 stop:7276 length:318 start_codon:yes stop_codon:yes gene_type:complete
MLNKFITFKEPIPMPNSDERRVLFDHREYLRNHKDTVTHTISASTGYAEQHNWYRYFLLNNIPTEIFYPIMIINGITDLLEFDTDIATIKIPSHGVVQDIISRIA